MPIGDADADCSGVGPGRRRSPSVRSARDPDAPGGGRPEPPRAGRAGRRRSASFGAPTAASAQPSNVQGLHDPLRLGRQLPARARSSPIPACHSTRRRGGDVLQPRHLRHRRQRAGLVPGHLRPLHEALLHPRGRVLGVRQRLGPVPPLPLRHVGRGRRRLASSTREAGAARL